MLAGCVSAPWRGRWRGNVWPLWFLAVGAAEWSGVVNVNVARGGIFGPPDSGGGVDGGWLRGR